MPFDGILKSTELNTIIVDTNNSEIRCKSPDAGNFIQCELVNHSDRANNSLTLSGEGSENYEIDSTTIPELLCNILKRPVQARFYNVFKEYDGTDELEPEMLVYDLLPTADKESGIVEGSNSNVADGYCYPTYIEIVDGGYNYGNASTDRYTCPTFILKLKLKSDDGMNHLFEDGFYAMLWPRINQNTYDEYGGIRKNSQTYISMGGNVGYVIDRRDDATKAGIRYTSQPLMNPEGSSEFYLIVKDPTNTAIDRPTHHKTYKSANGQTASKSYKRDIEENLEMWPLTWNIRNSQLNGGGLVLRIKFKIVMPTSSNSDSRSYPEYIPSDRFKVWINNPSTPIKFASSNPSDEMLPLNFPSTLSLGGPVSNNYNLVNVSGFGRITKRIISEILITPQRKVYDGTDIVNCKITGNRILESDDVRFEDSLNLITISPITGTTYIKDFEKLQLVGEDAYKYVVSQDLSKPTTLPTSVSWNWDEYRLIKRQVSLELYEVIISVINGKCQFYWSYNINNIVDIDDISIDFDTLLVTLDNGKKVKIADINNKAAKLVRKSKYSNDFDVVFGDPEIGRLSSNKDISISVPDEDNNNTTVKTSLKNSYGIYSVSDVIKGVTSKIHFELFTPSLMSSYKIKIKDRVIYEGTKVPEEFITATAVAKSSNMNMEIYKNGELVRKLKFDPHMNSVSNTGDLTDNIAYDLSNIFNSEHSCKLTVIQKF